MIERLGLLGGGSSTHSLLSALVSFQCKPSFCVFQTGYGRS